jgi:hypothetical protein
MDSVSELWDKIGISVFCKGFLGGGGKGVNFGALPFKQPTSLTAA